MSIFLIPFVIYFQGCKSYDSCIESNDCLSSISTYFPGKMFSAIRR